MVKIKKQLRKNKLQIVSQARKSLSKTVIFSFLLVIGLMTFTNKEKVYAREQSITREQEYTSKVQDEKYEDFEKSIEENGRKYTLTDITYKVIDVIPNREKEERTKTIESESVLKSSDYTPEKTITEDGISYELKDCSVIDGSEYKKTYTAYTDVLDASNVSKTKTVAVTDENGKSMSITAKLVNVETISDGKWLDNEINITFDHYDAGVFEWQGKTIYSDSKNPLEGYEKELLASVGVDNDKHRVISTKWKGQPYERDGIIYRDAVAQIQYFMNYQRANYSETLDYVKYQTTYIGIVEVESTTNMNYILKATAVYTMDNALTTTQIVLLISVGVAVIALFVVLILYIISKRKKEEQNNKEENGANSPTGGF